MVSEVNPVLDVIPSPPLLHVLSPEECRTLEEMIAKEVKVLLGWKCKAVSVNLMSTRVQHGTHQAFVVIKTSSYLIKRVVYVQMGSIQMGSILSDLKDLGPDFWDNP